MKKKRQIRKLVAFFVAVAFSVLTASVVKPVASASSIGGGITSEIRGCLLTAGGNTVEFVSKPNGVPQDAAHQIEFDQTFRNSITRLSENDGMG